MKLQLTVLDGGRAGVSGVFSSAHVTVGRHPESSIQFDPEQDLDVSGRHAVFARSGPRWIVRDQGSRNGTFVNGHPIRGETTLDDTDQVRLGKDGPTVEVRLVPASVPDRKPEPFARTTADPRGPAPRLRDTGSSVQPLTARGSSTTQRIRVEVGKQTRTLRILSGILVFVILAGSAFVVWDRRQQEAERTRERAEFQHRRGLRGLDHAPPGGDGRSGGGPPAFAGPGATVAA
jgi:pSer/pThr/pTyr-binding forkhead associated (FHA) protein